MIFQKLIFKINQAIKIYKYIILAIIIVFNKNFRKKKIIFLENDGEINNLKKYYELNNNGTLINRNKFNKVHKPKVSIISAVYNRDKFILRFIRSIQNQFFDDIEIIFIDDCSTDDSVKVIEENEKEDERIIVLSSIFILYKEIMTSIFY